MSAPPPAPGRALAPERPAGPAGPAPDSAPGRRRFLRFPGVAKRPRPAPAGRANGPSPAGASLRSALVPGWGQWAAGRKGRGLLLLTVATLALLLPLALLLALLHPLLPVLPLGLPPGLIRALAGTGEALTVLVPPLEGLLSAADWAVLGQLVLAANVIVLLFRGAAALDAARCARRPSRQSRRPTPQAGGAPGLPGLLPFALAALSAVLVLTPHVAFTGAALAAQPVLTQVLQPPPPAPVPAAGPAPEPTPSDPFAAVLPQLPPPDAARPVWDGKSALNVLLLGTDRRPRDVSMGQWGNSDTILLVSLDPARQQAAMVSVPRDLLIENIPGVGQEKVNAAYRRGGPDLAVRVVGDLLGVPIHRWASIDTGAFATMIDGLGGVVVDVERPIRDDEFPNEDYSVRRILIPSGLQWLDGERALWYARSRHGSNDFDRSERQQRLLLSLRGRARDPTVVPRLPGMVLSLADAVSTDVSPREALTLASLGVKTDFKTVRGLVLTPPEYGTILNRPDLFAVVPNRQRIRRDVATLFSAEASPASPSPSAVAGRPLTPLPVEPPPEGTGPAAPADPAAPPGP